MPRSALAPPTELLSAVGSTACRDDAAASAIRAAVGPSSWCSSGSCRSSWNALCAQPKYRNHRWLSSPQLRLGPERAHSLPESWKKRQEPHPKGCGSCETWRCGESNPGPVAIIRDFSGRSPLRFSRPQHSHGQGADRPSRLKVPALSPTNNASSGSLADARNRDESYPGLTDFRTRSSGECEVGALVIGTYRFADIVNEISLHSRPASP